MSTTAYIGVFGFLLVAVVLMLLIGKIRNPFIGWLLGAILFGLVAASVAEIRSDVTTPDVVRPSYLP